MQIRPCCIAESRRHRVIEGFAALMGWLRCAWCHQIAVAGEVKLRQWFWKFVMSLEQRKLRSFGADDQLLCALCGNKMILYRRTPYGCPTSAKTSHASGVAT